MGSRVKANEKLRLIFNTSLLFPILVPRYYMTWWIKKKCADGVATHRSRSFSHRVIPMIFLPRLVAVMMIEHKYLNWLKRTARAVTKLFSFIGIAFNTFRVAPKCFNQSVPSALSPKRFVNLAQWCSQFNRRIITQNIVCDLHVTKHDERGIVSRERTSRDDNAEKWQARVR